MNEHRNAWIDAARGSAALAVTFFHFNTMMQSGADRWREFWSYGHFGVPVFFVLSGWCVTTSWLKAPDWRDFGTRRLRRIFPAYLGSAALMVALAIIMKATTGVNDVVVLSMNWRSILAGLTLTTAPVTTVKPIMEIYWTLSYEVAFYGLLAALLLAPPRLRQGSLAALHLALCVGAVVANSPDFGPFFFVGLWPVFGLGCTLVMLSVNLPYGLLMLAASAGQAVASCSTLQHIDYLAVGLLTAGGLIAARHVKFPRLLRPLRLVGEFSYSLYLVHIPLGYYVVLRLFPLPTGNTAGYIVWQSLQVLAVCGLAWLFYLTVERRFHRPAPRPPSGA